jgi:adenylate cyclase
MDEANRRLAGILAADVVGYSAMVGKDEPGTLARVRTLRTDLVEPVANTHGGRLFKTTGDGFLAAFASAVQALRCAIAIQERLNSEPDGLRLRIGVHQGEVVAEGDDLLGDGVIIAARLEPLAEPGGICISARVREDAAGKIALEVDDLGTPELKNIAVKVQVFRIRSVRLGTAERPALPLPDKPSLVVLPFQNMSGDPEQEYFADGMVEEITTALSRIRSLFVIARNSAFTYKGRAIDVRQIGRELGVRYVLEGSVRKSGRRVRITSQLIETDTSAHLWADRFDGFMEDIFDLQDQVAISVAGVIEPILQAAEIQRSSRRPTRDVTAYDLYLRALPLLDRAGDRGRANDAVDLLERAVQRDPNYGPALALLALGRFRMDLYGWASEPEMNRTRAIKLIHEALRCSPNDSVVLSHAAFVLGYFGDDLDAAIKLADRALELNPSFAQGWYWSGVLRNWLGRPDVALEHFAAFLRLSPRERFPFYLTGVGIALFFSQRFQEAISTLRESLEHLPSQLLGYRFLAASYARAGGIAEARKVVAELRRLTPNVLESGMRFRNAEHRELYLSGLRLAIGPEL